MCRRLCTPGRFLFCFLQLRQLRFHLRNQHLQLLPAFLAHMRIHIPRVLFAVNPEGILQCNRSQLAGAGVVSRTEQYLYHRVVDGMPQQLHDAACSILAQTEQYARMYDINQSAEERCVRIGPSCFETAARSLQSVAHYEICKEQFRIVR